MDKRFLTLGVRVRLIPIFLLVSVHLAQAQQVIFLLRHAEAEASREGEDSPLTEVGQRRATASASLLKDAGINVIYTTERKRAIQTAEPIAKLLKIEPKRFLLRDRDGLMGGIRALNAGDRVLVVSHSLAVPYLLKALGHPVEITIGPKEHDNLFVIIPKSDGAPVVIRIRY
jgi:broad specificity phosphatase PhoE